MSVIFSLLGWILWDVAFSVYTEVEVRNLTPPEWILAGSGVAIAVLALVFEFRERETQSDKEHQAQEAHLREISGLHERLASQSGKLDSLALMGGSILDNAKGRASIDPQFRIAVPEIEHLT